MRAGTYYLNNSGSRWVTFGDDGRRVPITLKTETGREITRRVEFWEAFGNFATARIHYKGERLNVFPDSTLKD